MEQTFIVTAITPAEAWERAVTLVMNCGSNHVDERRNLTREILNLTVRIMKPLDRTIPKEFPWKKEQLDIYAKQYLNPLNDKGFVYTYGERIGNQIDYAIDMMNEHPETRRATIVLRRYSDILEESAPCLTVINFEIRENTLYTTVFFRSHDINQAAFANYYGIGAIIEKTLNDLNEYVMYSSHTLDEALARKVSAGPLTVYSISAHIIIEEGKK